MSSLLQLSRLIDRLNEFVGRWVSWLVLAAVLISAINASVRKAFDTSSNAFLEIQWYLFAAVFLLASGYTLLRQEHVKIDVILHRFTRPTQVKVEIFVIEPEKRPVNAVADNAEVKSVLEVTITQSEGRTAKLLSDPDHSWSDRILAEQFTD